MSWLTMIATVSQSLGKPYCLPSGDFHSSASPGRYWSMSTPRVSTGSITSLWANCGYLPRWSVNTSGAVSPMKPRARPLQ